MARTTSYGESDDPTVPGVGRQRRRLSIRASLQPTGITSHGGSLYVVDDGGAEALWRIDDPTNPGGAVLEGSISRPASMSRKGITSYWSRTLHGPRWHSRDDADRGLVDIDLGRVSLFDTTFTDSPAGRNAYLTTCRVRTARPELGGCTAYPRRWHGADAVAAGAELLRRGDSLSSHAPGAIRRSPVRVLAALVTKSLVFVSLLR